MRDPQQVKAEAMHADSQIEQRFYEISPEERLQAVSKVLGHYRPQSCVAFCFTKQQCQEIVDHLTANGISAIGLHGDLEQRDRDQVLAMFANRSCSVLVATDVAARGLDIDCAGHGDQRRTGARFGNPHSPRRPYWPRRRKRYGDQPGRTVPKVTAHTPSKSCKKAR